MGQRKAWIGQSGNNLYSWLRHAQGGSGRSMEVMGSNIQLADLQSANDISFHRNYIFLVLKLALD
jgi:hypothetical protein